MHSPRRAPPSSTPRNAEELASHVIHGSLRLTPSRQQILSYSGISLPDRPPQLLDERSGKAECLRVSKEESNEFVSEEENRAAARDRQDGSLAKRKRRKKKGEEEEEEDEEDSGAVGRRGTGRRRVKASERQREGGKLDESEEVGSGVQQLKKASESYVQQIKKRAHRIQQQKVQRMAASNKQAQSDAPLDRRSGRTKTATMRALANAKPPAIEVVPANEAADKRRKPRGSYSSTRSAFGSSSSIVDATGGEYSNEDRILSSPLSDSGIYHRNRLAKLDTLSVPSASSMEDLTVKSSLHFSRQQEKSKRNLKGSSSVSFPATTETASDREKGGGRESRAAGQGSRKRMRKVERGSSVRKRRKVASDSEKRTTKVLNGALNGQEYKVMLWDLVWAKCRGYPPYPALVSGNSSCNIGRSAQNWVSGIFIHASVHVRVRVVVSCDKCNKIVQVVDPDMSRKGLIVNGERIQPPSEEVLELRQKNPSAPHLVRFFDGKRSW